MVNLTNYPYPAYDSNVAAAGVLSSFIGISLIAWLVQSIQAHFKPRRPMVLLLIAHLTIFVELVLRAALSTDTRNSRAAFTATTVLLAIGQRMIILANFDYLTQLGNLTPCISRCIIIGSIVGAVGSTIIMAPAGTLSYNTDTIDQSFRLRQASTAIVLCMTILFYPIWFMTKTAKHMKKEAILLLVISSITCLFVAIYLLIASVPDYYVATSERELWYYIFQFTPTAIALFTWTILHPKRSLAPIVQQENENGKREMNDIL
jgi:cytochrome bd-type quinol oxidase subunit 2